jgi:hypothetical protein
MITPLVSSKYSYYYKHNITSLPLPSWMRSGHSFPPLRDGLVMYLTRNLTPEASGALQADQSVTIHGSGTVIIRIF